MNTKRKTWTEADVAYLRDNYAISTPEELSAHLGATWHAIKIKAFKLGINRHFRDTSNDEALINDYKAGMKTADLCTKYNTNITTIYRLFEAHGVEKKRELTNFGDNEVFRQDYVTLTKEELETKYGTSYENIKVKASNLGVIRPEELIKRPVSSLSIEELQHDYLVKNLTSNAISVKNGMCSDSGWVRKLLRRNNIIKPPEEITLQKMTTRIEKYGSAFGGQYGKTEKELQTWIKEATGLDFSSTYKILKDREIDLYNSDLKIGIEYCGLYWHNEDANIPKDSSYHYDKFKRCEEQGIQLITIFEDEWTNRQEQVKGALLSILGKNSRRLYGRKCEVRTIAKDIGNKFYEDYHIQGSSGTSIHFAGLYSGDELVGVMSFGRHHRDATKRTLDRLCFKYDVSVAGGSSKLFKFLLATTGITELTSWSDNRWFIGSVYEKLGFTFDQELKADYSYVDYRDKTTRLSKQSQKKSACGCPADMTEKQWALARGLHRIWDCGKKRWTYKVAVVG